MSQDVRAFFGIKCNQREKSQKPYSEWIAQCLSACCHDAAVVIIKKRKREPEHLS